MYRAPCRLQGTCSQHKASHALVFRSCAATGEDIPCGPPSVSWSHDLSLLTPPFCLLLLVFKTGWHKHARRHVAVRSSADPPQPACTQPDGPSRDPAAPAPAAAGQPASSLPPDDQDVSSAAAAAAAHAASNGHSAAEGLLAAETAVSGDSHAAQPGSSKQHDPSAHPQPLFGKDLGRCGEWVAARQPCSGFVSIAAG